MDGLIKEGTFNLVYRVRVSSRQLEQIADILGITPERGRLVSGIVYIETGPAPAARGRAARSSTASGTASSRTTSRRK
jgi:hypothetical protein